ncbi:hypothetical protein [Runella slithyformis]|uniref:Seryl-tRNA synthetase n=1 Tax=Runella slithyformis (strain ATCC 29530 / DSM 19594 / LMG 11500 / NCIMB 11436 / LSU 4) TaxID=761193 RepID=A0A7U3ZM97_RUNSL|nr:hypothetical protein [Runella slithyformis]AEI49807.1 hypothetical protein Runsl_3441 [Runella slithyformis DSM 19594]
MKTLLKNVVLVLLLTMSMSVNGYSAGSASGSDAASATTITPAQAQEMLKRLEEIKAMEPDNLTRSERKVVKKEVKQIKKAMREYNGVYLSLGAIIIIVLLLILIL